MKSSYHNNTDYGDIIQSIVYTKSPQSIVEFGILEGYSLQKFIENSSETTKIQAFDIFEDFNGNGSNKDIIEKFSCNDNLIIEYGDFYKKYIDFEDNSIDILHIDIANNGDVYKFASENYLKKLTDRGIMILEGGSKRRDEVGWMKKYNKPSINKFLTNSNLNYSIIGEFPSITLIKK